MNRSCLVVMLVFAAVMSTAQDVYLTVGRKTFSGTIIETRGDVVVIRTDAGIQEIPKKDIAKLEYSEYFSKLRNRSASTCLGTNIDFSPYQEVNLEIQGALTRTWAGVIAGSIGFNLDDPSLAWSLEIGPRVRPEGSYLKGFFWGLPVGVSYNPPYDTVSAHWFLTLSVEMGYQSVAESGWTLTSAFGARMYYPFQGPGIYRRLFLKLSLGYAFKNPLVGAR